MQGLGEGQALPRHQQPALSLDLIRTEHTMPVNVGQYQPATAAVSLISHLAPLAPLHQLQQRAVRLLQRIIAAGLCERSPLPPNLGLLRRCGGRRPTGRWRWRRHGSGSDDDTLCPQRVGAGRCSQLN
eukprot:COSAG01_NODE_286_length_19421_cov_123.895663_22_plen_128_part_00